MSDSLPCFQRAVGMGQIARALVCGTLMFQAAPVAALAAELQPATIKAWERYFQWADERVSKQLADPARFLVQDFLPPTKKEALNHRLTAGKVVVEKVSGVVPAGIKFEVPDGEIHHMLGSILVPNIALGKLLAFLQDYDNHAGRFSDVERSRLLTREGDYYSFFLRLKRTKAIVTAYYNTEQECTYYRHAPGRVSSRSTATKIAELEDPATPSEREKTPGNDRGFLWRLVSWWRFQQTDQGVIVECESASLSRDIPFLVKLIPGVASYIRSTPRESLESVLNSIRDHFTAGP